MRAGVDAEAPSGQRQLFVTGEIDSHNGGMRLGRMQVDRHAERLCAFEYAPKPLVIEKGTLGVAIDHGPLEAEPSDGPVKLLHRRGRISRRQPWRRDAYRRD